MSTTIDQRVVEMQFDNRHFERNVSTTMSTLDKFKQKLHLDGATKGLENVNSAARNVNLNPLGSAVESVQAKFSALQVMGVTALANITNSAVNAGKRIASALTIDPVKTGFQEYETQINAVQTILANTESKGTTIDDVNKALEELNTYADKTIYNFTEMTRNIGTFTAAGVDLDTSVNAIQGIANLAAVSGSTSQQASTAMYQLSQALSSGTVKLMDWNSVVNAGMGGQVFQDALKETARVHGVAIDDMIKEQGSFRETLSEGWLTSEILTDTLQKFTLTTEGLTAEQIKANREMLKAKGYTDEQIDGIFKLGNTATNAATKVKTFTQLWDVLKESAQSGWSQTWKLIIGDFEQAKSLLSPVAIMLTGVIDKFSDARNKVLEKALGGGKDSKWSGLSEMLGKAGLSMKDLSSASELLTGSSDKLNKSLDKTGTYTVKKGDYLSKIAKEYGTTWQEIYKLNKDIVDDPDLIYPEQVLKMPGVFQEMADGVGELTDAQLKNLGYTDDQIKAWRELEKAAKENGMTIEELLAELSKPPSGRQLLIESFKNAFEGFKKVIESIRVAWQNIFPPKTTDEKAAALYSFLVALNDFSKKLVMSDETADKLARTFRGLFAIIDIVLTVVSGPLKIAFKIVTKLLSVFGISILDVTAVLGDGVVKIRDWIDGILDFTGVFEKLVGPVKNGIKIFREWINSLKESENLPLDIAKGIASGFGKALKAVKTFFKNIPKYFKNGFDGLSDSPIAGFINGIRKGLSVAGKTIAILGDMIRDRLKRFLSRSEFAGIAGDSIAGLVNGLKSGASKALDAAVNMVSTLVQKVKDFLGIESPSKVFIAIGGFIIAGLVKGIIEGLPDVDGAMGGIVSTLKSIVSKVSETLKSMFSSATIAGMVVGFVKIANMFSGLGKMFSGVGDTLSGVGEFLETTASGVNKVLKKSAKGIGKILNNVAKVVKSFSKVLNAVAFETYTEGIKNLAIGIAILVGAVIILSLFDPIKLLKAAGILLALVVVLGALVFVLNKVSSVSASFSLKDGVNIEGMTSGLIGIGIAILAMAAALKMVGTLDPDAFKQGIDGLCTMAASLIALIGMFAIAGKTGASANFGKLGKTFLGLAIVLLIMAKVVETLGSMTPEQYGQGTEALLGFAGIIAAFMIIGIFMKQCDPKSIGIMILSIGAAIGVMGLVVKTLGEMESTDVKRGTLAILCFAGIVAGLLIVVSLMSRLYKDVGKLGIALLSVSACILLMAITVKSLSSMSADEIQKGTLAILCFAGIVAGLLIVVSLMSRLYKDVGKLGIALLSVSACILLMVLTSKLLSGMSPEDIKNGTLAILRFAGIAAGLLFIVSLMSRLYKDVDKLGNTLLSVAGAIAILALIAVLLGFVPDDILIKGTIIVGFLSLFIGGLILATSKAKDCMGNLIVLTVAIAVLSTALWALSKIPAENLGNAMVALGVVMGMFALVILATSKAGDALGALIVMSLAVAAIGGILYLLATNAVGSDVLASAAGLSILMGVLTGVVFILSKISVSIGEAFKGAIALAALAIPLAAFALVLACMSGVQNAVTNALALSILATVMTVLLIPLALVGNLATQALLGVLALTAMAVPLIAFVGVLAVMQNVQNAMSNALALTVLAAAMTVLLIPLTIVGLLATQALLGVLALTAMAVPLIAFVGVLAVMQNVQNAMSNALALTVLAAAMTVLLIPLTIVGLLATQALLGVLALTAMAVPLIAFVGVLAVMQYINDASENANLLIGLMTAMSDALFKICLVAPLALVGVAALAALSALAVGLVGVLTVLGALNLIPGFSELIAGGGQVLVSVGNCLSKFIDSMMPFIMGATMINPEMMAGVKALADTILILTAANVMEGLTSWLTGGSSLADFANQLPILGSGLAAFSDSLGVFTEEQLATVKCAANAVKTLAQVATELPNTGGLLASIVGENDLSTFASQFPILGSGLAQFVSNIGTFTDEQVATVKCAAQAIKDLASASSEIPNSGGLLASLVGENDLGTFASQFPVLGSGLANFLSNVGTFNDAQVSTVKCAANAIKSLANVAGSIPNSGGFWSKIVGDNDLGDFASKFPSVGKGLKGFVSELGTFGSGQVATVDAGIKAINSMTSLAKMDLSSATKNISNFGSGLTSFGKDLGKFCRSMPETSRINSAVNNLNKLLDAIKKIGDVNSGTLSTFASNLMKVGDNAVKKFVSAFTSVSARTNVKSAAKELAQKAIDGFKEKASSAKYAGMDLGTGLILGIRSKMTAAYNAGYALGKKAVQGEKDGQKSKSPSKATIQAGKWLGEGLIIGMEQMGDKVYSAGHDLGKTATSSMSGSISRIVDAINSDIDTQPTIRPVLDLTNVRAGASALNNLLDTGSSVGVVANVGRISGMMSDYSQNGSNSEIVSAIDKLNKRMDNLGNTTYQINGVTYDDGSNITDAVRTIVRAARIERRT